MPTTLNEIKNILEELNLRFILNENEDILINYHAENFINIRGDNTVLVVIQLSENGEYIKFFSPMAFQILEEQNKANQNKVKHIK